MPGKLTHTHTRALTHRRICCAQTHTHLGRIQVSPRSNDSVSVYSYARNTHCIHTHVSAPHTHTGTHTHTCATHRASIRHNFYQVSSVCNALGIIPHASMPPPHLSPLACGGRPYAACTFGNFARWPKQLVLYAELQVWPLFSGRQF